MSPATATRPRTAFHPSPPHHEAGPNRTVLQERGSRTLQRHLRRWIVRYAALVAADLAAFVVMREAVRIVRDAGALGDGAAAWAGRLVPYGYLGGWQFAVGLLIGLVFAGAYGQGDERRDGRRLFLGTALGVGLATWGDLWLDGLVVFPRAGTILALVCVGLYAERLILDIVVRRAGWRPQVARTLLVGSMEDCRAAASGPAFRNGGSQYRVVHMLDASEFHRQPASRVARRAVIDHMAEVVVVCGHLDDDAFADVIEAGREAGCELLAVPRRFRRTGVKPTLIWERDQPLFALESPELKAQQLVVKRIMDIMGSAFGLVMFSPLFALIALAIKLDSPGPVVFAQERAGRCGRVFRMLKFRTMRNGADDDKGAVAHLNHTGDPRLFKIPNDPRVTRIGRLLRKWSLDELPQLWNVLRGDMSLVGPRPFFMADLAGYADHHFSRLGAKPGITGLWQVKGRSSVVDFEEVVRLDREYIDRWSIGLDLKVLLLTLPAVLGRNGAW